MSDDNLGLEVAETVAPVNESVETPVVPIEIANESTETLAESTETPTASTEADEPKLAKGIQKRFSKLTQDKRDMSTKIEALEARLVAMTPKEPEYTKEDFAGDDDAYLDYKMDQKVAGIQAASLKQESEARAQQEQQVTAQQSWQSKIDTVASELPNYAEVVNGSGIDFTEAEVSIIMESDVGPQLAYELASNETLGAQFSSLPSARARDRFLTKLEMRLEDKATSPKAPAPPITKAPPVTPKSSTNTSTSGTNSAEPENMADWVKWRNKQLDKKRGL